MRTASQAYALTHCDTPTPLKTLRMGRTSRPSLCTPARVKRALTDEEIASMCTFPADDYVRQSGEMLEQGVLEHPAPDMDMHRGA